jgi:hypothetical protein
VPISERARRPRKRKLFFEASPTSLRLARQAIGLENGLGATYGGRATTDSRPVLERYFESRRNEVSNLFDGFESLNAELQTLLDRHHRIGHAFFMVDVMTRERLEQIWERKLQPLIEEYFFDQPDVATTFTFERFLARVGRALVRADRVGD